MTQEQYDKIALALSHGRDAQGELCIHKEAAYGVSNRRTKVEHEFLKEIEEGAELFEELCKPKISQHQNQHIEDELYIKTFLEPKLAELGIKRK